MRLKNLIILIVCEIALDSMCTVHAANNANQGEALFRSTCLTCHSLGPGAPRIGPDLAGVVRRQAGTLQGGMFSPAMRSSNIVWNTESLDRFLANPRQFVPSTSMMYSLPDSTQRSAVIDYLQQQTAAAK
ncbi:c-type cytochrome [Pseudomonas chlororaphis]|uniref:c-type cytochrome n=1 Tax=Pseudomonas chlororaphis TaxID=587753 RepID=UPI001B314B1F|nr:c-type cytochrome [Pseudomonas chlororaphis]MBP5058267.1 c-type cytochrome [Pseudomonas chlororaphis]MBP5142789.1 c-type cytochrome [Pseudomonas chlororaphis]QTT98252.1 c-type cytochrome [Pseudomonas chlororaphis]